MTAGIFAGLGLVTGHRLLVYLALILAAHIDIDRLLGFGLKYPSWFKENAPAAPVDVRPP